MQVDTTSQILKKQRICETIRLFDGELSKMHDAEVHGSCLCIGKGAMNEPEIKVTKRWTDYLEQYRESARRRHGEKTVRVPHISWQKRRTSSCARSIRGFDKIKEKMDNILLQKPVLIEFYSWD